MKNLNICIDIDGTITEAYFWLGLCNEYFNKNFTEEQITEYAIHKVLGVEDKEYEKFYEKCKVKMHTEQKLREDAQPVIKELSRLHNIYFVTARDKSLTMLTHGYLRRNEVPYDELFVLGSHYKVEKARELRCDVFIEDSYENAVQLSKAGFKVLLMDTNYNRKSLNEGIIRVYNWTEINEIINELLLEIKAI